MIKKYACALLLCASGFALAQMDDLEDINFPLNSSVVVDGFQGLDMLAAVMAKHGALDLEVIGHTDSLGTADYNKRLSLRRAESVKAYLVSKGAREGKIKTSGEGIDRSYDNATREGRFQNRRVSLFLYETVGGNRSQVSYRRLLELFFGGDPATRMLELTEKQTLPNDQKILEKLTDLEKKVNEMGDRLSKRMDDLEARYVKHAEEMPKKMAAMQMKVDQYTGVSVAAGFWDVGDQDDFAGQIRGLYFRPLTEDFALQAELDFSYYDELKDGQFDAAAVYQKGGFKLAAAGSYKWVSISGLETARIGQGALVANFLFGSGKIGAYGTFPFADGDVVSETRNGVFLSETYINVPNQLGLDFGVSFGDRVDLSGYAASIDGESDVDLGAGLKLDVLVGEQLSWFLQADMNEWIVGAAGDDDAMRYQTGLRLGSWAQARYNVQDRITPVDLPQLRYELLSRVRRVGNSAPIANAGPSRSGVAAGAVTLDGSGSADPEGDPLTFSWAQVSGPAVQLQNAGQAIASFTGVAGAAYVFELTVSDDRGDADRDSVTITMEAAAPNEPVIANFTASPESIELGQIANLTWSTQFAEQVTISGIGAVAASGSLIVSPSTTTEYTLTAANETGTATQTVTITVVEPAQNDPEINFFTATPDTIEEGEISVLSWSTNFADEVTLSGFGRVGAAGNLNVAPNGTTEYTLTATNGNGSVSATVTVTVNEVSLPEPTIGFFTAIPDEITEGELTTLSWSTEFAENVTLSGFGQVSASGSLVLSPSETTEYTLTATNAAGTASASVTVTVNDDTTGGGGRPPVASAGADQTLLFPGTVTLDGTGSFDPDSGALTYSWVQVAGQPVTLNGANTAMPTFQADVHQYTFRLTVTDAEGLSDTDEVTISVVSFKRDSDR